jgi:pimeloyl-ACP methyl ester carboxylesterase
VRRGGDAIVASKTRALQLADGRRLAYDDVGYAAGVPVVYLHGTPDCRLSRPPDDSIAAAVGVRLIAVDRPGYGESDFDPSGTLLRCADDISRLVEALGIDEYGVFGWSGGSPFALAVAARDPRRVVAVGIACALAPIEALHEPGIAEGADEQMRMFIDLARTMAPHEMAHVAAQLFAPDMQTEVDARAWILGGVNDTARAEIESVPGMLDRLATAVIHALQQGHKAIEHDFVLLTSPFGFSLSDVVAPVRLWYGDDDGTAPVSMGRYFAQHLPNAHLIELRNAGHFLPLPHWADILQELRCLSSARNAAP